MLEWRIGSRLYISLGERILMINSKILSFYDLHQETRDDILKGAVYSKNLLLIIAWILNTNFHPSRQHMGFHPMNWNRDSEVDHCRWVRKERSPMFHPKTVNLHMRDASNASR